MQITALTRWLFLCLTGLVLFGACADDEDERIIQRDQLPTDAQIFLTHFFPDQVSLEITRISGTNANDAVGYQVALPDEVSITFDESGLWHHISAENGNFPETLNSFFTEGMKACVRQNYPGDKIVGISNTLYGGDVITLQSNKQLAFLTFEDTFLGEVLPESSLEELPTAIREFISAHFPDTPYQWVIKNISPGKDTNFAYLIWLKGYVKLSFDADYAWNELHSLNDLLPASIFLSLPQEVQEYVTTHYPKAKINYISLSNSTCYTIQVESNKMITIDTDKNSSSVTISLDKVDAFIHLYFPEISSYSGSYPPDTWSMNVKLPNGIDFTLDKEYRWLGMDGNGQPLPEIVYSLFPEKIGEYIAVNATGKISAVKLADNHYHVVLTDEQGFLFDQQGEFVANEEISFTPYEKTYRYIRYHYPENYQTFPSLVPGVGWTYTLSDGIEVKFDMEGNFIAD